MRSDATIISESFAVPHTEHIHIRFLSTNPYGKHFPSIPGDLVDGINRFEGEILDETDAASGCTQSPDGKRPGLFVGRMTSRVVSGTLIAL